MRNLGRAASALGAAVCIAVAFCHAALSGVAVAAQTPTPAGSGDAITPFRIDVPDAVLTDLKGRLARTRFPDEIDGAGWEYGTNLAYLKDLVAYWRTKYDWRGEERKLNQLPQF